MFAIMEGVQSKALKILGLTWSNIDRTRRLEYLKEFVDPEENFSKLWTTHRTWGKKPCVPFIRTYFLPGSSSIVVLSSLFLPRPSPCLPICLSPILRRFRPDTHLRTIHRRQCQRQYTRH